MDNKNNESVVVTDIQVDLENAGKDKKDLEKDTTYTKKAKTAQNSQNSFKEKVCDVIAYNKKTSFLDIKFDQYGIRLHADREITGDKVTVKYRGEIGKPDFKAELKV